MANLACIGSPERLLDAAGATLIARALSADSAAGNQRAALACLVNLAQDPRCVQRLRNAQAETALKALARSNDAALRAPACRALRYCREVPDSTLQARPATRPAPSREDATRRRADVAGSASAPARSIRIAPANPRRPHVRQHVAHAAATRSAPMF